MYSHTYWYGLGIQNNERLHQTQVLLIGRQRISGIKSYDMQKDDQQATTKSCKNYEVVGDLNEHIARATANIDNTHFTRDPTYSF